MIKLFEKAFSDMKESAKAQYKVDKANFATVKAEAKAQFEEAKAMGNAAVHKKGLEEECNRQIIEMHKRLIDAEKKIENSKKR